MSAQVGNPIHAYNLIRRFSIDIGNIERDIQEDDWAGDEKSDDKKHKLSLKNATETPTVKGIPSLKNGLKSCMQRL